jgi:hypothetical protein
MTSQIRLTTPDSEAIRPRSTVATCVACPAGVAVTCAAAMPRLCGAGSTSAAAGATWAGSLPSTALPGPEPAAARLASTAPIARRWSRMMSSSRTAATTNRVSDG